MLPQPLTTENLEQMKIIEQAAYSDTEYSQFEDCTTWEEIAEDMDCEVEELRLFLTDTFYLLLAEKEQTVEIIDFARKSGSPNLFSVLSLLETYDCKLIMDCRQTTSYPIVKAMERFHKCVIVKEEENSWGEELFYRVELYTTKALERNPDLYPLPTIEQEEER